MTNTILLVFSLCVLCSAVLSLPVLKVESDGIERTLNIAGKVTEMAESFVSTDVKSVEGFSRVKRQVIVSHGCPQGTIWYANKCMPFEQ